MQKRTYVRDVKVIEVGLVLFRWLRNQRLLWRRCRCWLLGGTCRRRRGVRRTSLVERTRMLRCNGRRRSRSLRRFGFRSGCGSGCCIGVGSGGGGGGSSSLLRGPLESHSLESRQNIQWGGRDRERGKVGINQSTYLPAVFGLFLLRCWLISLLRCWWGSVACLRRCPTSIGSSSRRCLWRRHSVPLLRSS